MSKRIRIWALATLVFTLLLTACAQPATPAPTQPPAPTAAQPAATSAPAATPTKKPFRVGLVTDVGKIDDKSFNQGTWEGVQKAVKELGVEAKYIETQDPNDYMKNIAQFADAGYDVIVTVGFALGEATREAAQKYPNVKFIGVDQFQESTIPNVAGLIFEEDKAGFMAGALAALMSKTGKIGAVLGTDAVPPVWRFGEGYRAGAKYVRPDVEVLVVYHNDVGLDKTFTDPEWGKSTALSLVDKGVDVIFGAGGKTGNGALIACAETKKCLAIGVDVDQYYTVPEARSVLLTSAMKDLTEGTFNLIKAAYEGKWQGGNVIGPVRLAPFHDLESQVPQEVRQKLAEIEKGLKDGTIKTNVPPAKPQ
ncbi:MAG: BMP family ABC transporter substrate-binding protein [Thermoflexus sp.]|jgi:basic membrane protein A|nr:BMP family ABC transporter substrate-binding protein [Thermoflexus sp.]MDT7883292.1 BMP family ABC transporter substrate-binding protein [Thermoflexus sp.]MDT7946803.1 BMP family ABC transporter substrate-binding protein [Thermoflexus sp.]